MKTKTKKRTKKKLKKTRGRSKPRRPTLKTVTVETKIIPRNYKPPSKPPRASKVGPNVDHATPQPYSRARGIKPVPLPPQTETVADYGDATGYAGDDRPGKPGDRR